ncbi:MAG: hypothetical protein LQ342_002597 [Letrouitia transgressa]|nr:MAG: hypothetical protein LQ342_002597 [Letrouitia transgressa]
MGRLMHHLSKAKIPTLCVSKEAYEAAAASLPKCHQGCSTNRNDDEDSSSKDTCSSASSDSSTRTSYNPNKKGFPSSPSSVASSTSLTFTKPNAPQPSPLHIHDVQRLAAADLTTGPAQQQSSHDTTAPPNWQTTPLDSSADLSPSGFPTPSDSWPYDRPSERYQQHLADFADMLAAHIAAISSLIESVSHIQATRDTVKRLASCGGDQEARAADLAVRIVRLKAQGWRRERFAPERYQELCERALEGC